MTDKQGRIGKFEYFSSEEFSWFVTYEFKGKIMNSMSSLISHIISRDGHIYIPQINSRLDEKIYPIGNCTVRINEKNNNTLLSIFNDDYEKRDLTLEQLGGIFVE